MTLWTLALLRCNAAAALINQLPLTVDLAQWSGPAKQAAQLLKEAAGVFNFLASSVATQFVNLPFERPPEMIRVVAQAMATITIAQAQQLAIRTGRLGSNISDSVLAKLCIDVYRRFDAAAALLRESSGHFAAILLDLRPPNNTTDFSALATALRSYLTVNQALYRGLALRFLGASARKEQKVGEALGFLGLGVRQLGDCSIPTTANPLYQALRTILAAEIAELKIVHDQVKKENDLVYFERVPTAGAIGEMIPEGRCIQEAVPFQQPEFLPLQID
eukprot:TRINITY_DN1511_c0_g1_i1.p1 TRINITY_DN1511_c0_g1~~TRINITY_DN1511_c0_g1_i1.p1  ORF type:complete len:276 (-),score=52.28 TRINITY_DN1511_c0_g1_i1:19-846(-)